MQYFYFGENTCFAVNFPVAIIKAYFLCARKKKSQKIKHILVFR